MIPQGILRATAFGTVLQLAMVISGHYVESIASYFAVGGMGISLLAGVAYAVLGREERIAPTAARGAVAGAVCAFIGIFLSCLLGDVPWSLLLLGTASSAVTGAIGGAFARAMGGVRHSAAGHTG